jgi:hypothetical protein
MSKKILQISISNFKKKISSKGTVIYSWSFQLKTLNNKVALFPTSICESKNMTSIFEVLLVSGELPASKPSFSSQLHSMTIQSC